MGIIRAVTVITPLNMQDIGELFAFPKSPRELEVEPGLNLGPPMEGFALPDV